MANAVPEQTTKSNTKPIGSIPQPYTNGLFAPSVPHACDEHESWIGASFGGSTKPSEDCECLEAIACCLDHKKDTPVQDNIKQKVTDSSTEKLSLPHEDVGPQVFS